MSRKSETVYTLLACVLLSGCGREAAGWSDRTTTRLQRDVAGALYELAGRPGAATVLVWGRNGKPLDSHAPQLDELKKLLDIQPVVVDVDRWGAETDMLMVPVEAVGDRVGEEVLISLAGPLSGAPPGRTRYVCVLPPHVAAARSFPGLAGALLTGKAGFSELKRPAEGSDEFRDTYRIFQPSSP